MNSFFRNLIHIAGASLLCTGLSGLFNFSGFLVSHDWAMSLLFFAALTCILNVVYSLNAGTDGFTQFIIGAIVVKLLLSLTAILLCSFAFEKQDFFHFAMHFVSHFILFMIFEIRYLLFLIKIHAHK